MTKNKSDKLKIKYYEFIQYSEDSQLPLRVVGLFRIIQEHLQDHSNTHRIGYDAFGYRLIRNSLTEFDCIRENETFGTWLELSFGKDHDRKSILATCFPLYLPDGSFLIQRKGISNRPLRIRPIYTFTLNENNKLARTVLKRKGITPESVVITDFVDILERNIKRIFHYLLVDRLPEAEPLHYLERIAGGIDWAVNRVFGDRNLFPLADKTNALAEVSQSRSISILPLKVHKKSLVGGSTSDEGSGSSQSAVNILGDPVRNLLPVHAGFFCPVETPESKSVGLNLTLSLGCSIDNWNSSQFDNFNQSRFPNDPPESLLGPGAALIPFLQHTDPTRAMMGAKNMKQALPPLEGESPIIRTGLENVILGTDTFPLGRNVLVGYVSWHGLNYEDGIVISSTLVSKFRTTVRHCIGPYTCPEGYEGANPLGFHRLLDLEGIPISGTQAEPGDVIAAWQPVTWRFSETSSGIPERVAHTDQMEKVLVPREVRGRICAVHVQRHPLNHRRFRLMVELEEERPLEVGDKMMGRYGNKGVVSAVLPESAMPYFLDPAKGRTDSPNDPDYHGENRPHTHLEMLLSPIGVVGRMNLGQLLETHATLAIRYNSNCKVARPDIGRPFSSIDMNGLRQDVVNTEITDHQGKTILWCRDVTGIAKPLDEPCTVGWQYMMKLNHLARDKKRARGADGPRSLIVGQPCAGKRRRGGMKLGEMEMWCLLEREAWDVLHELIHKNSDPEGQSIRALQNYLRVLGVELVIDSARNRYHFEPFNPENRPKIDRTVDLRVENGIDLVPVSGKKDALTGTLFDPAIFGPEVTKLQASFSSFDKEGGAIIPLHVPCWGPNLTCNSAPNVRYVFVLPIRYRRPRWNGITPTPFLGDINRLYDGILRENNRLAGLEDDIAKINSKRKDTIIEWEREGYFKTKNGSQRLENVLNSILMASDVLAGKPKPRNSATYSDDRRLDHLLDRWSRNKIRNISSSIFHTTEISAEDWEDAIMSLSGLAEKSSPIRTYRRLNFRLNQLYKYIQSLLKGKKGLFRGHLLGRRIAFSARAVIVPCPDVNLHEVRVPEDIFNTLHLTSKTEGSSKEAWILINRPPSLLPTNVQAVLAKPESNSHVVRINPGLCEGLGADFDGDQIQLYALHDPKAVEQASRLLRPGAMPFLVKGSLALSLNKDMLLGLAGLNREELADLGRLWRLDVPSNATPKQWIEEAYRRLPAEERERFGARCLKVCFQKATQRGTSISFFELFDMAPRKRGMEKAHDPAPESEEALKTILERLPDTGLAALCSSKAVKTSQVAQIVISRGDIPLPHEPGTRMRIHSSYAAGLDPEEFFVSAMATREAMIFKKLRTACGGYFTRRMVECGHVFDQLRCTSPDTLHWRKKIESSLLRMEPFNQMASPRPWGLLAAHSLGEEGTQSAMKVFHTGDVGASGSLNVIEAILSKAPSNVKDALSKLAKLCDTASWQFPLYAIILQSMLWANKRLNQVYESTGYNLLARLSYRLDVKYLTKELLKDFDMNRKERLMLNP